MVKVEFLNCRLIIEPNQNGTCSAVADTGYGRIGLTFDRSATTHIVEQIKAVNDKNKIKKFKEISIILEE